MRCRIGCLSGEHDAPEPPIWIDFEVVSGFVVSVFGACWAARHVRSIGALHHALKLTQD
jgi:hypothetical protein